MCAEASPRIRIIDYGMGNVRSVQGALELLGCSASITNDIAELNCADGLILPGVGAFGQAMENLHSLQLINALNENVLAKQKPILGICLGMQLFADESTEMGLHKGLNWISGKVIRLDTGTNQLPLPHVGWNNVSFDPTSEIFQRIAPETHFYFDHSFHYETDSKYITCTTDYGCKIVAGIRKNNIWGMQFHPEKSQTAGLKVLRNFLNSVQGTLPC